MKALPRHSFSMDRLRGQLIGDGSTARPGDRNLCPKLTPGSKPRRIRGYAMALATAALQDSPGHGSDRVDETSLQVKSCWICRTLPYRRCNRRHYRFPAQRDSRYAYSYPIFPLSHARDACETLCSHYH